MQFRYIHVFLILNLIILVWAITAQSMLIHDSALFHNQWVGSDHRADLWKKLIVCSTISLIISLVQLISTFVWFFVPHLNRSESQESLVVAGLRSPVSVKRFIYIYCGMTLLFIILLVVCVMVPLIETYPKLYSQTTHFYVATGVQALFSGLYLLGIWIQLRLISRTEYSVFG